MRNIGDNSVLYSSVVKRFMLYDVFYTDSDLLRLTDMPELVVFGGQTYTPAAVESSGLTISSDGKVNDVTLTTANLDRAMQYYLDTYDMIGRAVKIREVFADADGVVKGSVLLTFKIKSAKTTRQTAVFTLSMGVDVLGVTVPGRKMYANFCYNQFKDGNCKYSGADASCTKLFDDCAKKGNALNFGGFPALVKAHVYV